MLYAELQVTTNFSFLRGASHADELVGQAKALRLAAIGVADRGQAVLNLAYYVNPNARFGIDWAHLSDNVGSPTQDDLRAFVWVGY